MTQQSTSGESAAAVAPDAKPRRQKKQLVHRQIPYPFWFGGSASSMAACVTHPLDLVKVRLQLRSGDAPRNMRGTLLHVARSPAGVRGLYDGLSASLLRQMTYSTVRFGVYEDLKRRLTPAGAKPSLPLLVGLSTFSGLLGGVAGNAADVTNVRMQQDAALAPARRRGYRHGLDGMLRMLREEGGVRSWFRGVWPNSTRAALMNAGQLASYDSFKALLLAHTPLGDTTATHFAASFLAGFVATTVCSPVDVLKSRVMSASGGRQGLVPLVADIYAREGVGWMFKGWVPAFLRLGP
ncbi:putative dicarboxylate carrier protein [Xylariaceae sp. FL0804]|nr:putative dicarboxylate carrier protein [Xylariaceae sp. FL0804]